MKTFYQTLAIVALAAVALTNCSKEPVLDPAAPEEPGAQQTMSFTAENPAVTSEDPETRTVLQTNRAIWQPDDVIGIYNVFTKEYHKYTHNDGYNVLATFTGPAIAEDTNGQGFRYYVLYPYERNDAHALYWVIPLDQHPVVYNGQYSYDPRADLLATQQIILPAGTQSLPAPVLERKTAVIRLVIGDTTTGSVLANDRPVLISLQCSSPIFGYRRSMSGSELSKLYMVQANYDSSNTFAFGNQSASVGCFLSFLPGISSNITGANLTVTVTTEAGRNFEKTFTLTKRLRLQANAITVLTVNMSDAEWTNKP